jgi:putative heme-binding domain-containing protein
MMFLSRLLNVFQLQTACLSCVLFLLLAHSATGFQPAAANAVAWDFTGETQHWRALHDCELKQTKGVLEFQSKGKDPAITSEVNLAAGWHKLTVTANWQGVAEGQVFWQTKQNGFDENFSVRFRERGNQEQQREIVVYFKSDQAVTAIRLDPLARPGKMQFTSIAITAEEPKSPSATPVDQIKLAKGFKAELLYSVPMAEQGSWVAMTHDEQGRLLVSDQYGKLYRVTPPAIGANTEIKIESIDLEIGMAQGMLCAFDSLYVVVNGSPDGKPSGLYRLQDTNADDQYDQVTLLREIKGGGEHGPHAVILSPDGKSLYVCGGNHTEIPAPESSRLPRNWQEDQLLPRMVDAGGHAVDIRAPGGWICQTDPAGDKFELIAAGFRNEYDIAFNSAGELFTYDADMEWDVGSPWYRPTRVCHVTSGAEFGWRTGTGKWPAFYPDSLPGCVDVGPGSPTGICFATGAKFPAAYQRSLMIADWSYGIIYAVHLTPDGATYRGELERFCSAPALQVTDMTINPHDGAMYFAIGGRKTQSGLYRVTYVGDEPTEPVAVEPVNDLITLRREIEIDHREIGSAAVARNWKYLNHKDRFIRYAARIAIEHQPLESWREQAIEETDPVRAIQAAIALARCGSDSEQTPSEQLLSKIDVAKLNTAQQLDYIRALGLVLIRLGVPAAETKQVAIEKLSSLYPNKNVDLNLELCRILVAVDDPSVVEKTIELLKTAPTQEEQIHYALCLRVANNGWTLASREVYFNWFLKAAALQGGHSFGGFLNNIRNEAIEKLTAKEQAQLKDLLARKPASDDPYAELKAMPFVKKWTVDELLADVDALDISQRDMENGRKMFSVTQCFKCHRYEGQGGIVGPDLTAAGRRFNSQSLLESIIEPSKVVSDQYEATVFELDNGTMVVGRVVNLSGDDYRVQEDMLQPGKLTNVKRSSIVESYPATTSLMPNDLINNLNRNQILDLIAFLKSATADENDVKKKIDDQAADEDSPSRHGLSKISLSEAAFVSRSIDNRKLPNIVLIISDDQAWTDYGFMGHEVIKTPRLDQLARESYTFTRGYVPTALCRPSLMTIISGQYAHQHKTSGNDPALTTAAGEKIPAAEYEQLRADLIAHIDTTPSLPRMLQSLGYRSFQSGKWWEGNFKRGGFTDGMSRGFPQPGGRHGDDGLKIGRQGMQPVFDFIDQSDESPFFLWYAPFLPHTPHNPPADLLAKYQVDGRAPELAKYYAMCEWFDQTCGALLDHLDEKKLSENTMVIYVTDNGWIQRTAETPVPKGWNQAFAPKSKQSVHEGGIRTPIMIRWPSRIKPQLDEQTLVSSIDIAPTVLAACGLQQPESMHGLSLLDHCQGKPLSRSRLFGEGFAHDIADINDPQKSLLARWCISENWKLIKRYPGQVGRYNIIHEGFPEFELFNLESDPHEQKNLADSLPDRRDALNRLIEKWTMEGRE